MSIRRSAALVLGLSLLVVACDHGGVLLAENQTDHELLARASGTIYLGSGGDEPHEIVAVLAPNSKLVVAELPFAGGFKVQRVDILAADCSLIDSLELYGDTGTYVVIDDDLHVDLRREYPESGSPAETTDRCRSTPAPSVPPAPVPSSA